MHQNTFLTTPDFENCPFKGLDSGGLEMHQNTFLTTPDVEKYLFEGLDSCGMEMHQNTFLNTPDVKNIFCKALILVVSPNVKKYLF